MQPPSEFSLFTRILIVPTSSQRMNGHQIYQISSSLTIMSGVQIVQCFRHFTNFTQSPRSYRT